MEFNGLVEKLSQLGFTTYEARAYLTLMKHHPVTGYELAKHSGVPPSKIYEVIAKLLDRSIISPLSGKPTKYIPQDNKIFLKNLRTNFQNTLDYLERNLPTLDSPTFDYVWNVTDRDDLLFQAKEMIRSAQSEIIILAWDEELSIILDELSKQKKCKVAVVQFGSMPVSLGVIYDHGIEKVLEREKGGRLFALVIDSKSLLQGLISRSGDVRGIFTSHPSLVELGMDYMKHEIYTAKMYDEFAKDMDQRFGGKDLKKLRDIWNR